MLPINKLFERLYNVAKKNITHQDYKRVVDLAKQYKAMISGEGIEDYLKQFNLREDEKLFEQRKRLTQVITAPICNALMLPANKVAGVRPIIDEYNHIPPNEAQLKVIKENADNYYGKERDVDAYINKVIIDVCYLDPNAFMLTTFDNFDNRYEKATVFSTIIPSKDVVDFEYQNNILQYVVIKKKINYPTDKKEKDGSVTTKEGDYYTIYGDNDQFEFSQVDPKVIGLGDVKQNTILDASGNVYTVDQLTVGSVYYISTEKNKLYEVKKYEHRSGQVPLLRTGYITDTFTDGRTMVNGIHAAMPYLMKTIKHVSELDLSSSLHAFPQKVAYYPRCPGSTGENNVRVPCYDGLTPTGAQCSMCKGAGKLVHTSSQDTIELAIPDNPAEMFDLTKMVFYVNVPIDIVKWLDEYIDKLESKCYKAIYSSDVYEKNTIAETATSKLIDMQSVYDALQPLADFYSTTKKFIITLIAVYRDADTGFYVKHKFPSNFKFESVPELIQRRQVAMTAGAPKYILKEIDEDISRQLFIDNEARLQEIESKEKLNPFSGESDVMIQYYISNNLVPERTKIIMANFAQIFNELEQDQAMVNESAADQPKSFYDLSKDKQKELFDAKVDDYMLRVAESAPKPIMTNPFTEPGQEGDPKKSDSLGKIPLAIQQLSLAKARAEETGDTDTAKALTAKINDLLNKIE